MKRNKIKPKYLNLISINKKNETNQSASLLDKIEHSIFKALISFGLILLLLFWSYIPMIFLAIFGIDYTKFSEFGKIIYMLISDILLLFIFIKLYYQSIKKDWIDFRKNHKNYLKTAFSYWFIGITIMIISNYFIYGITNGEISANEEAVRSIIQLAPWYMAFELVIFAPVTEEIVFRRSIRDIVKNPYIYAILSGFIFGGLHVISSLDSAINLLFLIPYCSLGIAFAFIYSKTNNIFSTISIHAFHNSFALILYLVELL